MQVLPLLRAQLRLDPILRIDRGFKQFAPKLIDAAVFLLDLRSITLGGVIQCAQFLFPCTPGAQPQPADGDGAGKGSRCARAFRQVDGALSNWADNRPPANTSMKRPNSDRGSQRARAGDPTKCRARAFCYSNADLRKGEAAEEIFHFIELWKRQHSELPRYLVFDSRLTTYAHLARLDQMGITFYDVASPPGRATAGG